MRQISTPNEGSLVSIRQSIMTARMAILELQGLLTTLTAQVETLDPDGTTLESTGTVMQIKDLGVSLAKLNSNVVDGTTLEKDASGVRIKDLGVSLAKLNSNVVDGSTLEKDASGLRIKDTGVTLGKLNSNVADGSTLEKAAGGLQIKNLGVTSGKLASASVIGTKIGFPEIGDNSELIYVPLTCTGVYMGDAATDKTIELLLSEDYYIKRGIIIGNGRIVHWLHHSSANRLVYENGAACTAFSVTSTGFSVAHGTDMCLNDSTSYMFAIDVMFGYEDHS